MIAQKGKRYEVVYLQEDILDSNQNFKIGDILISLENDYLPWCVKEEDFIPDLEVDDYPYEIEMHMMSYGEKDYKSELSPLED